MVASYHPSNRLQIPIKILLIRQMMLLPFNVCLTCFFSLAIVLSSCLASETSYEDHCDGIVPASPISHHSQHPNIVLNLQGAYIFSNNSLNVLHNLSLQGSINFDPLALVSTQTINVFQIHAHLYFRNDAYKHIAFNLSGFYSRSSGKICMVGQGMSMSAKGNTLSVFAVVKLAYPVNSSITNCLVHGSLECLDASRNLHDEISILGYSTNSYTHTLTSQVEQACSLVQTPVFLESLLLNASEACEYLRSLQNLQFVLDSSKFSRFMSFSYLRCTKDGKVSLLISFKNESTERYYSSTFSPSHSLASEGFWDSNNKRLCLIACEIHKDSHIGECDIGLTLRFPLFTLKNRNTISGYMWSLKEKNHPRYFMNTSFRSTGRVPTHPKLSYKYTENSSPKMSCDSRRNDAYTGDKLFTNDCSKRNYMGFQFSFRDSDNNIVLGRAKMLSLDDSFFGDAHYLFAAEIASGSNQSIHNVSYDLYYSGMEISTEGYYNSLLGKLCMVGCLNKNILESMVDCEIQVDIQFSSLKRRNCHSRSGHRSLHNGTIKSTRKKEDPLYFDTLVLSSPKIHVPGASELLHTISTKITLVFSFLSLLCVMVYFQLSNVMRNQELLQYTSIIALALWTIGYLFPIIDAYYSGAKCTGSSQAHDDSIMITTIILIMTTPCIPIRLLHIIWTSRNARRRRTLILSILFYSLGVITLASIARFTNWEDATSYCGLFHDLLLLSQIIEAVWKSKDNAVVPLLYVGTGAGRALPHLFDVYIRHCSIYLEKFSAHYSGIMCLYVILFVVIMCLGRRIRRWLLL